MVRGINKGKIEPRFAATAAYSAGISVTLVSGATWTASTSETVHMGILMQDVIAKPSAYYGTSGTFNAGSYQVIVDDVAYLGDKVRVCYGAGEYETDQILSGVDPTPGDGVFVGTAGQWADTAQNSGSAVGYWLTAKDANGRAKMVLTK